MSAVVQDWFRFSLLFLCKYQKLNCQEKEQNARERNARSHRAKKTLCGYRLSARVYRFEHYVMHNSIH